MTIKNTWNTGDSFGASDENAIATQVNTNTSNIALEYIKPSGGIPLTDLASSVQIGISSAFEDYIPSQILTMPRLLATTAVSLTSGTLYLTYFTADQTVALNNLVTVTGGTAAGATPTLCRLGIYSINSGNLTLIGSTPTDTTLWASINTVYTKALSAATNLTLGSEYALGLLIVTSAATPTLLGVALNAAVASVSPRLTGALTGQTDLPASITGTNVATSPNFLYMRGL